MHSFTIGVTAPVFELLNKRVFELTDEDNRVIDVIKQHSIVISDGIIGYYRANIQYPEIIDSVIDTYGNTNKIKPVCPQKQFSDGIEELLYCVSRLDPKILVGDEKDIRPHKADGISLAQTSKIRKGVKTLLWRYVFPVNFPVEADHSCEDIAKWFSILFKGEKKIIILDRYILNKHGINSLKQYYLPMIDKDAEINIYCAATSDFGITDMEIAARDPVFNDYKINIYRSCDKMDHDRYIELSNVRINIGAGLDILEGKKVRAGKECDINVKIISDKQRLKLPTNVRKIR